MTGGGRTPWSSRSAQVLLHESSQSSLSRSHQFGSSHAPEHSSVRHSTAWCWTQSFSLMLQPHSQEYLPCSHPWSSCSDWQGPNSHVHHSPFLPSSTNCSRGRRSDSTSNTRGYTATASPGLLSQLPWAGSGSDPSTRVLLCFHSALPCSPSTAAQTVSTHSLRKQQGSIYRPEETSARLPDSHDVHSYFSISQDTQRISLWFSALRRSPI